MLLPVLFTGGFLFYFGEGTPLWHWTIATFLLNVWTASIALFRDRQPYSINRMFWLFNLVFLSIIPALQVATGKLAWDAVPSLEGVLRANLLIFSGFVVYQLTRYVLAATSAFKTPLFPQRITSRWVRAYATVGLSIFVLLALGYFLIIGADALFLQKDILNKWRDRVSDAVFLMVEKAIRSPVLYLMLLSVFLYRLRRISRTLMMSVLGVGLLVNFPLAMPRTLSAAVVLSLALSFGGTYWQRHRQAFTLFMLAAVFFFFPLWQVARRTSERMLPPISQPAQVYAWSFRMGDFDAYTQLCNTLSFTDSNGLQKGRQLQTALAFAVPRQYWPQKSIGSGALIRQKSGEAFINVSSPLLAEGFIDFGWIGALVYYILFAILARQYDCYYWHWRLRRAAEGDVSFRALFYPVMLVLLFHLLRGDLLSSMAMIFGMCGAAWVFHHCIRLCGKWFFSKTIS